MSRNVSHKNVGPKLFFHFKRAMKGALISLPYFKVSLDVIYSKHGIGNYDLMNLKQFLLPPS